MKKISAVHVVTVVAPNGDRVPHAFLDRAEAERFLLALRAVRRDARIDMIPLHSTSKDAIDHLYRVVR